MYHIYKGGHGKYRAVIHMNNRYSPWFISEISAKAWAIIQLDRITPLLENGYKITGVTM